MATNGEKYVDKALSYEGVREATGNNDGAVIRRWQDRSGSRWGTSYRGAPWCAIFCENMQLEAGLPIPHPRLFHPYTGYICSEADRLGGLKPGATWPTGALIIWCSTHVGIVVRDRGNGTVDTLEGNSGNAVRRLVRSKSGARCIVWPGCGSGTGGAAPITMRDSFGFDDVSRQPTTYGPWTTAKARDKVMAGFTPPAGCWGPVPVKLDKDGAQFAFRVGKPGVPYGATWRFGGWPGKATRDQRLAAYKKGRPDAKTRTWKKRVPAPSGDSGSVTGIHQGSTT